jgi:hypothetical protein
VAITLDPTVGGASANSYGSFAEAQSYFATRLGAGAWTNAPDDDTRKAALITATRNIDANIFRGTRLTGDQILAFPRAGLWRGGLALPTDRNPDFVKQAEFEEALALLEAAGDDINNPTGASGLEQFKSLGVGDIRMDMRDPDPDNPSRTLLSQNAYRLLMPYLLTQYVNEPTGVRNVRILRG